MNYLVKHRDRFRAVVCASDNDEGGIEMAENLGLDHEPPPNGLGDWNDAVRALRDDPHALDDPSASKRATAPSRRNPPRPEADDLTI